MIALYGSLVYGVSATVIAVMTILWAFEKHEWRGIEITNLHWLLRGVAKMLLYAGAVLFGALCRAVKSLAKDTAATKAIKNL